LVQALLAFLDRNDMMAYLVMMAIKLVELHSVLKPTGSIYLHCDPTASHYLKMILDSVFDVANYRNQIAWKRTTAHSDTKQGRRAYGNVTDILLFYTKAGSHGQCSSDRETVGAGLRPAPTLVACRRHS
jgi:adenine specific DNA methylase Mod